VHIPDGAAAKLIALSGAGDSPNDPAKKLRYDTLTGWEETGEECHTEGFRGGTAKKKLWTKTATGEFKLGYMPVKGLLIYLMYIFDLNDWKTEAPTTLAPTPPTPAPTPRPKLYIPGAHLTCGDKTCICSMDPNEIRLPRYFEIGHFPDIVSCLAVAKQDPQLKYITYFKNNELCRGMYECPFTGYDCELPGRLSCPHMRVWTIEDNTFPTKSPTHVPVTSSTTTTTTTLCYAKLEDMRLHFAAAHSTGEEFIEMQWEDNMRMGGQYRTVRVGFHPSYAMYRYENLPDELLGAYYLEAPWSAQRNASKEGKAGRGLSTGSTNVTVSTPGYVYVISETGVLNDGDPYDKYSGGFAGMNGWTKLEVGPKEKVMFNEDIGENLPSPAELNGPWSWFEVGGQHRFAWRLTCVDFHVADKVYSSNYFSVWRKPVVAGDQLTLQNTEFWTGGLAFQPMDVKTCLDATSPGPANVPPTSCKDLTSSTIPSQMEKKTLQVGDKPVTGRQAWYAASVPARMQAIAYNSGQDGVLRLLNENDQIVSTVTIGLAENEMVEGVKLTIDGQHVVVGICSPDLGGARMIKYSVPDLEIAWDAKHKRNNIHLNCASISPDKLSLGRTRYLFKSGGFRKGHQSDIVICFHAETGMMDWSCIDKHASHSQTMVTAFNPQLADPEAERGTGHVQLDAGDAYPEKLGVSVGWEPKDLIGHMSGKEIMSGNTVFQGQRTHFGGLAPKKKGGGFGMVASFSGQGVKFGGNEVEQPPKMFFGTVDRNGRQMTCMKPLLEENGQIGPSAVAISDRRFLLTWTKINRPIGNRYWGRDYGIEQTIRDSGVHMGIVNLYGQLEAEPIHLAGHPLPVEVRHLVEDSKGISWIYVSDGSNSSTIQLSRIKCEPQSGGPVPPKR
jgi:hypothetical protein